MLCEVSGTYDFLTSDYIDKLAEHLRRCLHVAAAPITILEVGTGDGRLSHFLRQALQGEKHIKIVATDSSRQNRSGPGLSLCYSDCRICVPCIDLFSEPSEALFERCENIYC